MYALTSTGPAPTWLYQLIGRLRRLPALSTWSPGRKPTILLSGACRMSMSSGNSASDQLVSTSSAWMNGVSYGPPSLRSLKCSRIGWYQLTSSRRLGTRYRFANWCIAVGITYSWPCPLSRICLRNPMFQNPAIIARTNPVVVRVRAVPERLGDRAPGTRRDFLGHPADEEDVLPERRVRSVRLGGAERDQQDVVVLEALLHLVAGHILEIDAGALVHVPATGRDRPLGHTCRLLPSPGPAGR